MKSRVIAKNNLYADPHTWTKGLDYELIQEDDHITLASNEGHLHYNNTVKDQVLNEFEMQL